jgi:hypothetical protein
MAATDNIIGMVIIVSVLLIAGIILQTNYLNQASTFIGATQDVYEQKKASSDIDSILQLTEPVSKLKLSKIITDSVYANNGVSKVYGFDFNQVDYIKQVFDSIYGSGNYFVEIKPPITKIRLFFLMDGSSSMQNDMNALSKIIPSITNHFKDKNYIVESKTYVLVQGTSDNPVKASNFTGMNAVDVPADNVIGASGSGCSFDSANKGVYNKYFFNNLKKTDSNYYVGWDLYTHTTGFDQIPSCIPLIDKKIRGQHYEDWASGVAFVAKDVARKSVGDFNDPTLTIIAPLSDEIASGSEADNCYDTVLTPSERNRCELCNADQNRFLRAERLVKFATDKIRDENFDYIVFPIAIRPETTLPSQNDQNFCGPDGEVRSNCSTSICYPCCDKTNCNECNSSGIHNNQTVISEMISEMNSLATATGGEVIDLTNGYSDENEFLGTFLNAVEKAEKSIFIGEEKKEEKIVINRLIPTSNSTFVELRVGFYKDTNRQQIQNLQVQNQPPVLKLYYSPSSGTVRNGASFSVTLDARNSFDPEGEDLNFSWKRENVEFSTNPNTTAQIIVKGDHNFEITIVDPKGASSNQKFVVKATESNTKARLFFVPVNWDSSTQLFTNQVALHANKFKNQISCGSDIEIVALDPVTQNCSVSPLYTGYTTPLSKLKTCAQMAGYQPAGTDRNSRVIGLTDDTISISGGYTILGYTGRTALTDTPYPVIATYTYDFVTSHELGHTFSACDEYSLHEWLRQKADFTCPNQYPLICGYNSTTLAEAPVQMLNSSPYCSTTQATSTFGTYLNCKNFYTKATGCGNGNCDSATETDHTCPQDCFIMDCPGEVNGSNISIMGSVLSGDYSSKTTAYSSSMVATIQTNICN